MCDGVAYPINLADIGYDGSGVFESYLDCLLSSLNSRVLIATYSNQCYPVFDFKCLLFSSWISQRKVSSTVFQISKVDKVTTWLRANCPTLS